jgi:3-dehydroquinate synthase
VVTAEPLVAAYGEPARAALAAAGWSATLMPVPDGESSKTLAQAGQLYGACLAAELDRGSTLFAVGGGVIGDLTGFVAGTYMRGIDLVQVPTTLLSQVDASVGGKTAVDLPQGKNLVGVFHQPRKVVIDTATLGTLPLRDLRAGMAEIVKHAAIADAEMFAALEAHPLEEWLGAPEALQRLVARNCQIKAEVVVADPREKGVRAWLNYGHTVGHAMEAAAGHWDLRHGEAVAYGMVAEALLAVSLGLAAPEVAQRQAELLAALGLAQGPLQVDLDRARQALWHDKKIERGTLKLPLVPALGQCVVRQDVPVSELVTALEQACGCGDV